MLVIPNSPAALWDSTDLPPSRSTFTLELMRVVTEVQCERKLSSGLKPESGFPVRRTQAPGDLAEKEQREGKKKKKKGVKPRKEKDGAQ